MGIVKLDAEQILPHHPLFRKLTLPTVKEILLCSTLIRVKHGAKIYKEGVSSSETSYLILYGKFLLHTSKLGPIGVASTGDSLGEEGILERSD